MKYNTSWHSAINLTPFEVFRKRKYSRIIVDDRNLNESDGEEIERTSFDFNFELFDSGVSNTVENESRSITAECAIDKNVFKYNTRYLELNNAHKQVHFRKKEYFVGDTVLIKKDFDNNPTTKREKFESFFENEEYIINRKLENDKYIIQSNNIEKVVSKALIKKIK